MGTLLAPSGPTRKAEGTRLFAAWMPGIAFTMALFCAAAADAPAPPPAATPAPAAAPAVAPAAAATSAGPAVLVLDPGAPAELEGARADVRDLVATALTERIVDEVVTTATIRARLDLD